MWAVWARDVAEHLGSVVAVAAAVARHLEVVARHPILTPVLTVEVDQPLPFQTERSCQHLVQCRTLQTAVPHCGFLVLDPDRARVAGGQACLSKSENLKR